MTRYDFLEDGPVIWSYLVCLNRPQLDLISLFVNVPCGHETNNN